MKKCFICMPLIPELDEVCNTIKSTIRDSLGSHWTCVKADDTRRPGMIEEKIAHDLLNSSLVIAVVVDPREGRSINPNVMYELGVAHSFRKPSIVVADAQNELPFDIHSVETIQIDFSSPSLLSELRKLLEHSLRYSKIIECLENGTIPSNPITTQLRGTRVFIEDLPWLWGYCDVLRRAREAATIWEITRDLYWPGEPLFFASTKEAIWKRRKRYFMIEDQPGVLRKVEAIKRELLRDFPKNDLDELIHFVAIDTRYFVLWPITIVLYDADLVTRRGGIICEPMQPQVGNDSYDAKIRELFGLSAKSGDIEAFVNRLLDLPWTEKREEATFDIALDGRVIDQLATSFVQIWNEKILEESKKMTDDERSALLNTWIIGG